MSGRRFDDLARVVARNVPRRTVLKGMAGAVGAAVARLWRGGTSTEAAAPGDGDFVAGYARSGWSD